MRILFEILIGCPIFVECKETILRLFVYGGCCCDNNSLVWQYNVIPDPESRIEECITLVAELIIEHAIMGQANNANGVWALQTLLSRNEADGQALVVYSQRCGPVVFGKVPGKIDDAFIAKSLIIGTIVIKFDDPPSYSDENVR